MGYDCGDSFPFDYEPNGVPFGSKSKGKLSPRSYPIQFERKWNTNFLSVCPGSYIFIPGCRQVFSTYVLSTIKHDCYYFISV